MNSTAKDAHDQLRHTQSAYGVKVRILSYDDIEAHAPDGMQQVQIWQREFDDLTTAEQDFIKEIVDEYHLDASPEAPSDPEKRNFTRNAMARGIYTELRKSRLGGVGTSTTMTAPLMQDKFAPSMGPAAYEERQAAIVIYRPNDNPAQHIAGLLGMPVEELNLPTLDEDEWNFFTLAHELSHAAGADEAQADRIATARYVRTFGKDDVPQMWITLRSLIAMQEALRGVAVEMAPQVLPPQALQKLGLDTPERRARKLGNIRRYGWGPAKAIADQLAIGTTGNKALSEGEIHAIRFELEDTQSDRLFTLARTVLNANPTMNPLRADLREIVPVLRQILPQLKQNAVTGSDGIDDQSLEIAKSFLQQAEMLMKNRAQPTVKPRTPGL